MNIERVREIVRTHYRDKWDDRKLSSEGILKCVVYETFVFECMINEETGLFEGYIVVGAEHKLTTLLGQTIDTTLDEESVKESLQRVDDYCRLRLPDKFLKAHEEGYIARRRKLL